MSRMRIVFCGTPDYAVPSLQALAALKPAHEVVAVVSQPDRPKGRSGTPTPPPVAAAAFELGFPRDRVFQPKSINRPDILEALRALAPDLLCVVAYGGLLKQGALDLAAHFPINAHGSLLPKYRGAAPIQAALLAGDAETGVCIMKMELGLDTGPVLLERRIPIAENDTAGTLHDRLAELSARCFVEAVEKIAAGPVEFVPQNDAAASYAGKLTKDSGRIDWSADAGAIVRLIRAMTPWPGAWTTIALPDGTQPARLRIVKATFTESCANASVGTGNVERDHFAVHAGIGTLAISQIQPEGKREMAVPEFLRGAGKRFNGAALWR
jgi:methionyl-tRNA formyltransferase